MLEIKDLVKVYGKGKDAKRAVDGISLSIPKGSFFGLLGPNGAGKSTTIHCITGVAQPTEGTITIDGLDAVKDYKDARLKVGLSPQEFNVDIFATPEKLCARCHGIIVRDWKAGTHGLRQGGWLVKEGKSPVNFTCTECHDPHSPKFKYKIAAPPPTWPEKTLRQTRHSDEDPKSAYLTETIQERF